MLNQNPHREIKLPALSPIANAKVVITATSENLVNQATKENLAEPVQKISITDYLEENSKLLSAFWICFSLAALLSKNMNIDYFGPQLAIFFPALILLWETYVTFPRTKKISASLSLFYTSMVGVSLFFLMYLILPLKPLIPESPMIQLIIFLVIVILVALYINFFSRSLKPDTSIDKTPQLEK